MRDRDASHIEHTCHAHFLDGPAGESRQCGWPAPLAVGKLLVESQMSPQAVVEGAGEALTSSQLLQGSPCGLAL